MPIRYLYEFIVECNWPFMQVLKSFKCYCYQLGLFAVSSQIVAEISESSLPFSQCFFRPHWNKDKMLSENYPYL